MAINLHSFEERAYIAHCKRQSDARALLSLVYMMVIEEVHPSQFTCLPPSPEELVYRAELLGLITGDDYCKVITL